MAQRDNSGMKHLAAQKSKLLRYFFLAAFVLSLLVIVEVLIVSTKQTATSSSHNMITSSSSSNHNKLITLLTSDNVGGKKSSSSFATLELIQSNFLRASVHFEVARRYERMITSETLQVAYSVLLRSPYDRILMKPIGRNSTNYKHYVTQADNNVQENATILLDLTNGITKQDEQYLQTFIKSYKKKDNSRYHLNIAVSNEQPLSAAFTDVFKVRRFDKTKTSKKEILIQLLRAAKGKFIVIARQMLINIPQDSPMLLPKKDAGVVGLPYVDVNGTWHLGCYQIKTLWYQFRILKGHALRDKSGVVTCDYLNGPFAIERKFMLDFLERVLTKEINGDMIFLVLFKYLKELGKYKVKLVLNHTIATVARSHSFEVQKTARDFWLLFLKKNGLSESILPNSHKFEFTCEELGVGGCGGSSSVLIAKCCIRELEHLLKNTAGFLLENNFHFNLDGGTTIGSMKLGMTLPWEKDHDVEIHGRYARPLWDLRGKMSKRYGYSMFQGSEMKEPHLNVSRNSISSTCAAT